MLFRSVKSFQKDRIPAFIPNIFLEDGCSLEQYGVPADIIHLPGHTQGSIGIDVMKRELIVGDALMNLFYPTISMLYHDKAAMQQSADKISRLGERRILFGHGKPEKNRDRW